MKLKLLALASLFISVFALGAVPTENIRLEFSHSPIGPMNSFSAPNYWLNVDSQGLVFAKKENFKSEAFVAALDAEEMAEIEALIEVAKSGNRVFPPPPFCDAIPTESYIYAADNGKVILLEGSRPCGGSSHNDSMAARELVEKLKELSALVPKENPSYLHEING